jgi:hypothetical protein
MARKKDRPLDLRAYLAKARGGTTKDYRKKATILSQGSPADAVFYIEKGQGEGDGPLHTREGSSRRRLGERAFLW